MIYRIHITSEEGVLLNSIKIDTDDLNWDSQPTINLLGDEIIDEIKRAERRKK